MDLPTYTNIWRIEKRLYKLYDLRLPAPLPITWIGVFVGITVPYVIFLIAIGLPFNHTLVWLYILPPGVLTWLTTRPVIEGKRLPELVTSQVRYMTEPQAWCRMAPFAEKDEISVSARVWHAHPPKVRPKKAPARARPGAPALQAASTNVADARPPLVAGRAASPAVPAPVPDPAVPPSAHVRVPARASGQPEATPVKAAPRAKLAWSPWPRGSAPETGAPESAGDHAPVPNRPPAWMIARSHAAGTPDPGTLEVSHDSEPPEAEPFREAGPSAAADGVTTPESVDAHEPRAEPPEPGAKAPEPVAAALQLPAGAAGPIIVTLSQLGASAAGGASSPRPRPRCASWASPARLTRSPPSPTRSARPGLPSRSRVSAAAPRPRSRSASATQATPSPAAWCAAPAAPSSMSRRRPTRPAAAKQAGGTR